MTKITDEHIDEFIELSRLQGKEYTNRQEAYEDGNNLVNFFKLLIKIDQEDKNRKKRLLTEPQGFEVEVNGVDCRMCGHLIMRSIMWYDQYGMKCLGCQKAIDGGNVPGYILNEPDSFLNSDDMWIHHNIRFTSLKKMLREKKLNGYTIECGHGTAIILIKKENEYIYALEENRV